MWVQHTQSNDFNIHATDACICILLRDGIFYNCCTSQLSELSIIRKLRRFAAASRRIIIEVANSAY